MNNSNPVNVPYIARQARLAEVMSKSGLDCVALNPGPSLMYLTGLNFHLMERPVVALFLAGRVADSDPPQAGSPQAGGASI